MCRRKAFKHAEYLKQSTKNIFGLVKEKLCLLYEF